ncbi:TonB-dependent receptor plug domain-containing protein [Marinobacter confluentis]|uniref:TonB-dependent receptor plug domain-containing protein n=1 Tax=Marinobacter confluentis TaxID=1697557 RepID=UPI001CDA3341|nr:TonB-dependent receptor [Marinobacter confluentis]
MALLCISPGVAQAQANPVGQTELQDDALLADASALPDAYGVQSAIPEVLTTTRLRQPKSRVPGTTSIISGDMIRKLGIMNLVEVFRLVPGMTVNYVGSNVPVTSYHGTVHYEQRRMQVQVDGRTSYRANLSQVEWNTMPVPLELIERIEISRGPNSAAYGINAFLGTINIITRAPEDSAGIELRAISGSRGYRRAFGSYGGGDNDYTWRLAYEKRMSDGFDEQFDTGADDPVKPFINGYDINTFSYDGSLALSPDYELELRAGVVEGVDEEDSLKEGKLGSADDANILVDDYYLQSKLNVTTSDRHFFHIQASFQNYKRRQRWTTCISGNSLFAGDPEICDLSDPNDAPVIAILNEDIEENRLELELQDTLLFSPNLKLVSGLGYRKDSYESETYFNGRGNNYQSRAFGNLEYSPLRWLTLNAGGNWEKTSTTDDSYFSPRIASNFILDDNHTLRFVFSKAVRTPDAFEQDPDWSYRPANVAPPFEFLEGQRFLVSDLVSQGSSTYGNRLEEERITSREISYFGQYYLDEGTFTLEARYFHDELTDMISGIISTSRWTIDNNIDMDQEGFELEGMLEYPGTRIRATYAYLDQDTEYVGKPISDYDRDQAIELVGRLSVRHSGSVALIKDLPYNVKAATAFYWADEFRLSQFERADFRLAKQVYERNFSYELALTMQHYVTAKPTLSPDNKINDQNQFFVEAGIRF